MHSLYFCVIFNTGNNRTSTNQRIMTKDTVILYSSTDGHTLKICLKIKEHLESNRLQVDLFPIDDFQNNIHQYKLVIIGASIRYGVHHKKICDFIHKSKSAFETLKTVFFSVNLVARKKTKNSPQTNPYVIKFFKKINWEPTLVAVFAGKLAYKKYPLFDRLMIQFIMWMTKGPTDINSEIEYTDWKKVELFSEKITALSP